MGSKKIIRCLHSEFLTWTFSIIKSMNWWLEIAVSDTVESWIFLFIFDMLHTRTHGESESVIDSQINEGGSNIQICKVRFQTQKPVLNQALVPY